MLPLGQGTGSMCTQDEYCVPSAPTAQRIDVGSSGEPAQCLCRMMMVWRGLSTAVRGVGATIDSVGAALQGHLAPRENLMPAVNRLAFQGKAPSYDAFSFVAPNAAVMGDVTIGPRSSVWYGATLRGDVNSITVGHTTNIQDKAVLHVARHNPDGNSQSTQIGNRVRAPGDSLPQVCLLLSCRQHTPFLHM